MYPFFTGLCGYIFGRNAAGNLDPSDIGVANKKFLKVGAPEIDKWNKRGLINSSVTDGIAKQLFLTGKAAYYVTGPVVPRRDQEVGRQVRRLAVPEQQVRDDSRSRVSAA